MKTYELTDEVIQAAIRGFEAEMFRLEGEIANLRSMLNGERSGVENAALSTESARPRRKLSASARKRMAAAQRKRWAAVRGENGSEGPAASPKARPKRKLSAAGKAAIAAATKKRWAAFPAATSGKRSRLSTPSCRSPNDPGL